MTLLILPVWSADGCIVTRRRATGKGQKFPTWTSPRNPFLLHLRFSASREKNTNALAELFYFTHSLMVPFLVIKSVHCENSHQKIFRNCHALIHLHPSLFRIWWRYRCRPATGGKASISYGLQITTQSSDNDITARFMTTIVLHPRPTPMEFSPPMLV